MNPKSNRMVIVPIMLALAAMMFFVACKPYDYGRAVVTTAHVLNEADSTCAIEATEKRDLALAKKCASAYRSAKEALRNASQTQDECMLALAIERTFAVAYSVARVPEQTAKILGYLQSLPIACTVMK